MSPSASDFKDFVAHLRAERLGGALEPKPRQAVIRRAHAQYLALIALTGELVHGHAGIEREYGDAGVSYLKEVVSDCSEFMICNAVGLHRAAGGVLRSAIESYLKAFAVAEVPTVLSRTSVPEVFNDASTAAFFKSGVGPDLVAQLKAVYKSLNSYVHTVDEQHMFGAEAIGVYPIWSDKSEALVEKFVLVVRFFLYGAVAQRRDLYDQFDHRNKVLINRAMTRPQRRKALGVDD